LVKHLKSNKNLQNSNPQFLQFHTIESCLELLAVFETVNNPFAIQLRLFCKHHLHDIC
jgi:hypothetical protein